MIESFTNCLYLTHSLQMFYLLRIFTVESIVNAFVYSLVAAFIPLFFWADTNTIFVTLIALLLNITVVVYLSSSGYLKVCTVTTNHLGFYIFQYHRCSSLLSCYNLVAINCLVIYYLKLTNALFYPL